MPRTTPGARSWHGHPLPPAPAAPRPTPARRRPAAAREVFVFECACFLFPPVFRPRNKQTWPGEGREERKKKRTISQRSIPNPGCLACKHPPTHRVLWGAEKAPRGSRLLRHRSHPNLPCPASPPTASMLQTPPSRELVQQAWGQPRKAFGAAQHPTVLPREGGTTLRQLRGAFVGFWDGGVVLSPAPPPEEGQQ